jgi:hypothetical protein
MSTINDDTKLIVWLSGVTGAGCSLNESPKKNWVEKDGGLPPYICAIAKGVMKSGKQRSTAIAIAVSRTKMWAAGGGKVNSDTKAKAAAAVAQWEKLKATAAAKKVVKASVPGTSDQYLMLDNTSTSFNTDIVRAAYNKVQQAQRQAAQAAAATAGTNYYDAPIPYSYIKELWTDYIIVNLDDGGYDSGSMVKIPYTVDSSNNVDFGSPIPVEQQYVEVSDDDTDYSSYLLSDNELELLSDLMNLSNQDTPAGRIAAVAKKLGV